MPKALASWQTRVLEGVRRGGEAAGLFAEPGHGPSLPERFAVYREGYWLRVSESLRDDFPLTERLQGARRFEATLREFLAERRPFELELGEVSQSYAAWFGRGAAGGLARALRLDRLALEARRAPEPGELSGGEGFGLHPSARFFRDEHRGYVFWRLEGIVRRERIDPRTERLLAIFALPAGLVELQDRLAVLGEEPAFVQGAVAEWTEAGLICEYPGSAPYSPRGE